MPHPLSTGTLTVTLLAAAAVFPVRAAQAPATAEDADISHATLTPRGDMRMLLEKTIFKVDVLTLDVWLDDDTRQRLDTVIAGRARNDRLADSVAAISLTSHAVEARIHFWRDITFQQFLDAVTDDLEKALAAKLTTPEGMREVVEGLPVWFSFLYELGPRRHDEITYRIRGDTLHTVYRRATGETEYDDILIGPAHRNGVLGPYFAPKTSFREKLIASLWDR